MKCFVWLIVCAGFFFPLSAGADWGPVAEGLDSWGASTVPYAGGLVVGGFFGNPGHVMAPAVAFWDGTAWQGLGGGIPRGYPAALAVFRGDLIAAGYFESAGGIPKVHNIARWDGIAWNTLGLGLDGTVRALVEWQGKLIAGGSFSQAGGRAAHAIACWDGDSWSPLGSGVDGNVSSLAVYDNRLIVGGHFSRAGGIAANNIAAWDGAVWSPLGEGIQDPDPIVEWGPAVWALTVYGGKLVAAGLFSTAGDQAARSIAQWDGTAWSPLGAGITSGAILGGAVGSLAVYRNRLVAAGLFDRSGDLEVENIAVWNGRAWAALQGGTDAGVLGLTVYDGDLVAVGAFENAGNAGAGYIARWNDAAGFGASPARPKEASNTVPPHLEGGLAAALGAAARAPGSLPLPSQMNLSAFGQKITLRLRDPGSVRMEVFDIGGARVCRLLDQPVAAGTWQYWWNGRDDRGVPHGAGVYLCRASTPEGSAVAKLVYVK